MNKLEQVKKMLEQDHCKGIDCNVCPIADNCSGWNYDARQRAIRYIEDHGNKSLETAKLIVKQGDCHGIYCTDDQCPLPCKSYGYGRMKEDRVHAARRYIKDHEGGGMDRKEEAKARLEAIKKEVVELERIIAGELTYNSGMLYVGVQDGIPYIMVGFSGVGYRFNSFILDNIAQIGWAAPITNPQACLDYHRKMGFEIHVFSDAKEGFQFFVDNYKK